MTTEISAGGGASHAPLNVLMLAWNFPPAMGGMEYVAWHVAQGLRAGACRVRVVARAGAGAGAGEGGGLEVVRPRAPGLPRYLAFALWHGFWWCLRERPAVIVCPGIVDAPIGRLLSCLFRRPLLLLAHGSDARHGGRVYRPVMKCLFRGAAGVAANSRNTADLLLGIGCQPGRVRVIHPGVDAAVFPVPTAEARRLGRVQWDCEGRRVLLSVGRLIRRKGVLEFVEQVMPGLVRQFPDVLYVIAGGDATASLAHHERLAERIRARVEALGLTAHVRLVGVPADAALRQLYQAADLFLLPVIETPGDVEGFGIVFLEAALAGLPVVATRCGGIPEAVKHGETGLLVASGDWAGLAEGVGRLLADPEQRKQLGEAGRLRARSDFDWPVIVGHYRAFLEALAAGAAGGGGGAGR